MGWCVEYRDMGAGRTMMSVDLSTLNDAFVVAKGRMGDGCRIEAIYRPDGTAIDLAELDEWMTIQTDLWAR